jgi:hypothetical protein
MSDTTFPLPIECVRFVRASHTPHGPCGYVDLLIAGALQINDLMIGIVDGEPSCSSPTRAVMSAGAVSRHPSGAIRLTRPLSFPSKQARLGFSAAALAAIRIAFPDALPDDSHHFNHATATVAAHIDE